MYIGQLLKQSVEVSSEPETWKKIKKEHGSFWEALIESPVFNVTYAKDHYFCFVTVYLQFFLFTIVSQSGQQSSQANDFGDKSHVSSIH